MYRLMSVAIVLLWAGAMTALFMRDVYPAWTAQDVPPVTREQLANVEDRDEQLGIFDEDGRRRGTTWSNVSVSGGNTAISGTVHMEGMGLLPAILIETVTEFDEQGDLDNFQMNVYGVPATIIRVRGERHGIYFPCELQMGPIFRQANLDVAATRLVGDAFRPFSYLPALKVGQSWRMQIVDPVSAVMGGGTKLTPIIARVTAVETISHEGKLVECFVVETSPAQSKAWVGSDGRVYMQEMTVPGFGRLTVRAETFDESARSAFRQRFIHKRTGQAKRTADGIGSAVEKARQAISDAMRSNGAKRGD